VVDAVVVGAGVVGATVAAALRRRGVGVLLLDNGRPGAGTPPSGGHLHPGWFGGLPRAEVAAALALLDETWGLLPVPFRLLDGRTVDAHRVDTDAVLAGPRTRAEVTGLVGLDGFPVVRYRSAVGGPAEVRCRLLVVAAGVWTGALLPRVVVTGRAGVSFRLRGTLSAPLIRSWAPYKQVTAHQQSPGEVWAGDGSALKPENWTPDRTAAALARCRAAVGDLPVAREVYGVRPYAAHPSAEPCLLLRSGPRVWVATGAGKMGTIAAGWVAGRVLRELPG
jgi:glycine/D-amino acid oxidase-like deaminating enzyme